jgi:hypothetical protein
MSAVFLTAKAGLTPQYAELRGDDWK